MIIKLSQSGDELILPVNPSQMSIKYEGTHTSHSILNYGEIAIPDSRKLTSINFESFFPASEDAPYIVTPSWQSPSQYIEKLTAWMDSKNKLEFTIEDCANPLNISCLITSFEIDEKPGAPDDINYKISLKEYRDYKAVTSTIFFKVKENEETGQEVVVGQEEEKNRDSDKVIPKTYTVKSGDALWRIAKQCMGDGSKYKEIAKYNGLKNPNLIFPGQVLKIPPQKAVE